MLTLVLPPLTQLNTPYPSTAYLKRALRGRPVVQRDLGIELVWRLYSRAGLAEVFDTLEQADDLPEPAWRALALRRAHESVVEPVLAFLAGRDRTLAPRILETPFLPRGPRASAADLAGFGPLSTDDAARHLATLYLEDLADLVTATVDEGFALSRYQHHLAAGAASFDPLAERLARTTLVDAHLDALADTVTTPVVGLSVPFPGNLYAALRLGRRLRARGAFVLLGGGYVNTELREADEPRLWDCVDALCFDDGEGPLRAWLDHLAGGEDRRHRTRTRDGWIERPHADEPASFAGDYEGLPLDRYLQVVDTTNPAHRLWGDGRWNKVTVAHGCYWRRCSFCDIQLDYVARYGPTRVPALVDAMEEQAAQTGIRGWHLVDEAAPPRGVRDLALELLRRGVAATWWGNVRFERAWTPDLARLCAAAGMVAVTGGLEVASDRLLRAMDKGVTVDQAVATCRAFRDAGVLVHAYLMYGFPTQTEQETVDAAEVVRQLFARGLLTSAFWHRFVLTAHSGMIRDPARYGFVPRPRPGPFARNDLDHDDPTGAEHDRFDGPLVAALDAWKRGDALERPIEAWLGRPTTEPADRIARADTAWAPSFPDDAAHPDRRLVWLGGDVLADGRALVLHGRDRAVPVRGRRSTLDWLAEVVEAAAPHRPPLRVGEALPSCPEPGAAAWGLARRAGLVVV